MWTFQNVKSEPLKHVFSFYPIMTLEANQPMLVFLLKLFVLEWWKWQWEGYCQRMMVVLNRCQGISKDVGNKIFLGCK